MTQQNIHFKILNLQSLTLHLELNQAYSRNESILSNKQSKQCSDSDEKIWDVH
jgi:hypothetical protein